MTDLTEQFENDKLAKGAYYCRSKLDGHKCLAVIRYDGELYDADYNGTLNKGYWEVLAPVPSYEKWQAKLEENTKLKEELKDYEYQHKQDGMCYDDLFCKLELDRKENRTLKKMLKECKPYIALYTENNKHIGFTPETANLLQQIKETLGEDKCQLR